MTTTPAPALIEPVALIFKLNNSLVARGLDDLSDEEIWRRPGTAGNPVGWILGHITESRASLLAALGEPMDTGWGTLFGRGSQVHQAADNPAVPVLRSAWKATHARMRDSFSRLTDARLAEAPPGPPRPGATTVASLIAFYAFHETYHVGQIAYVKRILGHPGIAD